MYHCWLFNVTTKYILRWRSMADELNYFFYLRKLEHVKMSYNNNNNYYYIFVLWKRNNMKIS